MIQVESASNESIKSESGVPHQQPSTQTPIERFLQKLSRLELPAKEHFESYLRHKWRLNHKRSTLQGSFASVRLFLDFYGKSGQRDHGLGYFLFGAFAALAPTIGEGLGLGPRLSIWLVSTYLFARSAVFLVFWRWDGWEYRPGWVAAALALSPPALAATLVAPSTTVVVAALALLGASSGIAYSAFLHASLDREGGEGEGGGIHEWVIGIGVLVGPLAGAAGAGLFGGPAGAGALVTALGAAAAIAGLAPLRRRG